MRSAFSKKLLRSSALAVVWVAVSLPLQAKDLIPSDAFRDLVIFNHFDPVSVRQKTIGIETEAGGLSTEKVIESLTRSLGGTYAGLEQSGTEQAHIITGTAIGKIKIEPVNLTRLVNRYAETHPNSPLTGDLTKKLAAIADKQVGTFEIVTEPLRYDQVQKYALALDDLGLAGAKGTKNFLRMVSQQVNIGIDPKDIQLIKNTLSNYYDNAGVIRADVKPALSRWGYLNKITAEFQKKLADPNWLPTSEQLYDEYLKGGSHKLARVNFFNALMMDPKNYSRFQQPAMGKAVIPRPVMEAREANTVMSTVADPTASSRSLMREVDFAVSLLDGSKENGDITVESERALAMKNLRTEGVPIPDAEREPLSFRKILDQKYVFPLKTRPVHGASVAMANPEVLSRWGIDGTKDRVNATIISKFGHEVDVSDAAPTGTRSDDPTAPFATAHNDAAGGRGDGRAFSYDEINGHLPSAKGVNRTPYTMKQGWATMLKLHTGGTDGKMKFKEGVRTWALGELLHSFGITSERAAAILDNQSISKIEGKSDSPSAILLRELPAGGIRNSHIYEWDKVQTRRGLEYLKNYAELQNGRKFTDTAYVAFDAMRSGEMAAKMQDLYIVHGALAKGNVLAYPGLVDIAGMSFLQKPDPEFIGFAYLSRFGNQTNRLKELMLERHKAYSKTNPLIKEIDTAKIYEDSFNRELSLRTLGRLGLDRDTAEKVFDANPRKAIEFNKKVWDLEFNNLGTDMRKLLSNVAENRDLIASGRRTKIQVAQTILDRANQSASNKPADVYGRRSEIGNIRNKLARRFNAITSEQAKEVLSSGLELIEDGLNVSPELNVSDVVARAHATLELKPPTMKEFDEVVNTVVAARTEGGDVDGAFTKGLEFIDQYRNCNARFNDLRDGVR